MNYERLKPKDKFCSNTRGLIARAIIIPVYYYPRGRSILVHYHPAPQLCTGVTEYYCPQNNTSYKFIHPSALSVGGTYMPRHRCSGIKLPPLIPAGGGGNIIPVQSCRGQ